MQRRKQCLLTALCTCGEQRAIAGGTKGDLVPQGHPGVKDGTKEVGVSVVIGIGALGLDHLCPSSLYHRLPWCHQGLGGVTRGGGGVPSLCNTLSALACTIAAPHTMTPEHAHFAGLEICTICLQSA